MGNSSSNAKNLPKMKIVKGKKEYINIERPPLYESISNNNKSAASDRTVSIYREVGIGKTEDQYRTEFRKRILASIPNDISYLDNKIRIKSIDNMISPYDPYILRMGMQTSDKLYIDADKIIGVPNLLKYIDKIIDTTNTTPSKPDIYSICDPIFIGHEFIKEVYPEYCTIIDLWVTIIGVHGMYMKMWDKGNKLQCIFGNECKPFNLNFIITDKYFTELSHNKTEDLFNNFGFCKIVPKYTNCPNNIRSYNSLMNDLPQEIKRREDGLPDFDYIKNKFIEYRSKTHNRLIFYINARDIRTYISDRENMLNTI